MMALCDIDFQHGNSLQGMNCKNVTSKGKFTNVEKEQIIKGTTQSNTKKNEDRRKIARQKTPFFLKKGNGRKKRLEGVEGVIKTSRREGEEVHVQRRGKEC